MTKEAAAEWKRLAPKAHKLGTLTTVDLVAFELLVNTLAMEVSARQTLADEGLTVVAANGGEKSHPAISVMTSARSAAIRMLGDFGLTPRGRMSVEPAPPDEPDDRGEFFDS